MSVPPSRLRALETARHCATLGARQRTIAYITGLSPTYILRSVYSKDHPVPKGRPSYSEEFYFRAVTRVQAAASLLASRYRTLTSEGFLPADALIASFRHLRSTCPTTPLSFDEAFFLVANLDGIWASSTRSLALVLCPSCGHHYLAPESSAHFHRPDGCPVCRVDWSAGELAPPAPTVSAHVPAPGADTPSVEKDIARARLHQRLDGLGASSKVASVLTEDPRVAMFRPNPNTASVTTASIPRPLSLVHWSANTHVTDRAQFAVFSMWYRQAHELGVPRAEALCAAFGRMRTACRHFGRPVKFDRCFEVAALLDGAWGVPTPRLQLVTCGKCSSHYLLSLEEARPTACPFCALVSRHRVLLPPAAGAQHAAESTL